jgi:manganese transport protein
MRESRTKNSIRQKAKAIVPGIITAALVFGPSKMTITSRLGADYGYAMLWIVVVAIFFMLVFTSMGARIGAGSKISLLTHIRNKWGNKVTLLIGVGVFLVTTSFQAGNSVGVGIAVSEATNTPVWWWIVLFNLFGIGLLFLGSFYKVLEKLMIALVALMLFSFMTTLFLVKPSVSAIAGGLVPSLPEGSAGLLIAFIASCFSIVGAFYQSYLEQENKSADSSNGKSKSSTGILLLGVMSAVVIICAATVLHPQGISVNSAAQMSGVLAPLFGPYAANLFLAGLFGASFSSLVGNATVGGSLLGDALGLGSRLNDVAVKGLIALVMIAGASIALVFGKLPLELIIFAQRVTIFLVPLIGFAMYAVANDPVIMGQRVNNRFQKASGAVGLALLTALAFWNLYQLMF